MRHLCVPAYFSSLVFCLALPCFSLVFSAFYLVEKTFHCWIFLPVFKFQNQKLLLKFGRPECRHEMCPLLSFTVRRDRTRLGCIWENVLNLAKLNL